jgi:acyl-coenzyme A thioesterase PaaI-like protein
MNTHMLISLMLVHNILYIQTKDPRSTCVYLFIVFQYQLYIIINRFEYNVFLNKNEQKIIGIIYFGSHVSGAPGYVQGGAIATILDFIMGNSVHKCEGMAMTAYLNLQYKKAISLNSFVQCEGKIERIEGKKIFVNGVIKSLDGSIVHTEADGLWIRIPSK